MIVKKVIDSSNLFIVLLIAALYYPIKGAAETPPIPKNKTKGIKIDFILIEKQKRLVTVFKDS